MYIYILNNGKSDVMDIDVYIIVVDNQILDINVYVYKYIYNYI